VNQIMPLCIHEISCVVFFFFSFFFFFFSLSIDPLMRSVVPRLDLGRLEWRKRPSSSTDASGRTSSCAQVLVDPAEPSSSLSVRRTEQWGSVSARAEFGDHAPLTQRRHHMRPSSSSSSLAAEERHERGTQRPWSAWESNHRSPPHHPSSFPASSLRDRNGQRLALLSAEPDPLWADDRDGQDGMDGRLTTARLAQGMLAATKPAPPGVPFGPRTAREYRAQALPLTVRTTPRPRTSLADLSVKRFPSRAEAERAEELEQVTALDEALERTLAQKRRGGSPTVGKRKPFLDL
jgi:hypothetical protein